jgi:hypothetical protein
VGKPHFLSQSDKCHGFVSPWHLIYVQIISKDWQAL